MLRVNADEIELTNDHIYQWNGHPFSGVGIELDINGVLISEIAFENGIQSGTSRCFYTSGRVKVESNYWNNTLNGFAREWDDDGLLLREDEYEKGICICRKVRSHSVELTVSYMIGKDDPQYTILQLLRSASFSN